MVSVNNNTQPAAATTGSASSAGKEKNNNSERVNTAPSGCATRGRADDSALAAASLAAHLRGMEAGVLDALVRARETAAGITAAFPGGDERFADVDSESGEELTDAETDANADEGEPCVGLFDDVVDSSPGAALRRAQDESGLDLLGEMRRHKLPFHARVRAANCLRGWVKAGVAQADVVARLKVAMADKASPVWCDDALLKPVIEGDLLLTALDDDTDDEEDDAVAERVHNAINGS